jgi:hypothetical protein
MMMTKFWSRHGADFFKEKKKMKLIDKNFYKFDKITNEYFEKMYNLYYEIEIENK